jgi:hypothetical protein
MVGGKNYRRGSQYNFFFEGIEYKVDSYHFKVADFGGTTILSRNSR